MSRFWNCTITECSQAAAIDVGICRLCSGHFCIHHYTSPEHTCETEIDDKTWHRMLSDELQNLRSRIHMTNLLERASQANHGRPCRLDALDDLSTCPLGGMHVHLRIKFDTSGESWLARVPRINESSFSNELTDRILLNECATLKWLEDIVEIPTPRLHRYGLSGDTQNDVGVAYMLIDEMAGKPFDRYSATGAEYRKVYGQWASFMGVLSQHTFRKIGSLTMNLNLNSPAGGNANGNDDGNGIDVGPVVGDRTGVLDRVGPFATGREFYLGLLDEHLRLIGDRQIFGHFSVDAYLMIKYMRALVDSGKHISTATTAYERGPFYLKHTDDKGDHLLVDDDMNICGVIDWSFARVVPAYEAFGLSLLTADMGDIFAGRAGRSEDDRIMAQCVRAGGGLITEFAEADDRIRRLQFGIGIGMGVTREEALDLFRGLLATVGEVDGCNCIVWEEWRERMIRETIGTDETLQTLLSRERGDVKD